MSVFLQIDPVSLRDQVVDQVRAAIIEGRLKPGDHIVMHDLTGRLGVSRTPVREALLLLEQEGLVTSIPNRGFFVRVFTEQDVEHIFSMRTTLENFAGELIINKLTPADFAFMEQSLEEQNHLIERGDFGELRRVDMDYHRFLVHSSEHPFLIRTWSALVAQIAAILYIRAEADPEYDEYNAIRDHEQILGALKDRDLDALKIANRDINHRVADVCCRAIQRLNA